MPIAVDPRSPGYVETTVLPEGKYQGRTLAEVASTTDGLKYLENILTAKREPAFMKPHLRAVIRQLIESPERQMALKQMKGLRR